MGLIQSTKAPKHHIRGIAWLGHTDPKGPKGWTFGYRQEGGEGRLCSREHCHASRGTPMSKTGILKTFLICQETHENARTKHTQLLFLVHQDTPEKRSLAHPPPCFLVPENVPARVVH